MMSGRPRGHDMSCRYNCNSICTMERDWLSGILVFFEGASLDSPKLYPIAFI